MAEPAAASESARLPLTPSPQSSRRRSPKSQVPSPKPQVPSPKSEVWESRTKLGRGEVMDLTKQPPRSPHDKVGGMTFLPRSIDKMRAHIAGTNGAYNAKTGYSTALFSFLGVTADEFEQIVRDN